MKKKITSFTFLGMLFLLFSHNCFGQVNYLGLKGVSNVRKAQNELTAYGTYWPKTQLIGDYLYIPTKTGIYRKNLTTTANDTIWQVYAFQNIPIRAFLKHNDTILAATATEGSSNLLLLSTDDGQTYTDHTSPSFFATHPTSTVFNLAMNPQNHNEILAYHMRGGVSKSNDFGNTWTNLNSFIGGYQDWFVGFNPHDTTNIFYTGEQIFFKSFINASYDSGATWDFVDAIQTHCTHGIAFHPTNKNIMISYGEGRIAKSINQGHTWGTESFLVVYIYKIIYDSQNPNILYATGDHQGENNNITVFRSIDGGENWHTLLEHFVPDSDGALDIHLYNGKLFIFTLTSGIYSIDPQMLKVEKIEKSDNITMYPNPAKSFIKVNSEFDIEAINIYDLYGKQILSTSVGQKEISLNLESLSDGMYLCSIITEKGIISKKLVKK